MQELTPDRNFNDKEMTSFLEWVIHNFSISSPLQEDLWSVIHAAHFKQDNKVIPLRNTTLILDSPFIPLGVPPPEQIVGRFLYSLNHLINQLLFPSAGPFSTAPFSWHRPFQSSFSRSNVLLICKNLSLSWSLVTWVLPQTCSSSSSPTVLSFPPLSCARPQHLLDSISRRLR